MDLQIMISLLPLSAVSVAASLIFYLLLKKTAFGQQPERIRQILIGCGFGFVAILGTELGVNIKDATINARDAAPLCAGLFFGAPAGLIAGLIGGVWRYAAAAWGAGYYSRVACSISTCLAGLIGDLLRRYMFDDKRPNWIFSFAIGTVMEVLHLSILFLTHLSDPGQAFAIVKLCTIPMVFCNGFAVMLSSLLISLLSSGLHAHQHRYRRLNQLVQTPLLVAVILAFCVSCTLIYYVQTGSAQSSIRDEIRVDLAAVKQDILDESDDHILEIAREIAEELNANPDKDLGFLKWDYELADIYVIDSKGIVTRSTDPSTLGYDMRSDEDLPEEERQSSAFLVLLSGSCQEYVQACRPLAIDHTIYRKLAGVSLADGGFVQVGIDLDTVQAELENQIRILTANRRIGRTGYLLVADNEYQLISSGTAAQEAVVAELAGQLPNLTMDRILRRNYGGTEVCLMLTESEGFYVAAVVPEEEVFASRNNMLYIYAYMEILIFALLFMIIYIIVKRRVVDNIRSVNESLGRIIGGNLDVKVDVHSSEEFASLSDDINSTVSTLKNYIEEAAGRIDKELAMAKNIQYSALPSVFPAFPARKEFDIYATMRTAREVGGDFYDFYFTGENRLAFLIADVSGKGIPAALFMMRAKSIIKDMAENQLPVQEVMRAANNRLCEGNEADMFVTAWLGLIDLESGQVVYCNAGHNPPLLCRKGQAPQYLRSRSGFVLAGMEDMNYRQQELTLQPGDRIFLYTDGVTEATNAEGELYGEERLLQFLTGHPDASCRETLELVQADIDRFVGEAEQFDDITMLVLDLNDLSGKGQE